MADNKNTPVVSSRYAMLGTVYNITPTLTFDVELFYRRMYGLPYGMITYRVSGDSLYNVESELYLNYLVQKTAGIDLMLKKSFGSLQSWITYTLSESNFFYNSWLKKEAAPSRDYFPYNDDQRHEIKFYNTYYVKNWNFSLSWIFGSGKPWNFYELNSQLDYIPFDINAMRLDPYHRMDIGAQYNKSFRKMQIKTGVNIFNAYNHRNHRSTLMKLKPNAGIEAVTGGNPLQMTEIYGLGFAPNFFINVSF